MARFLIYIPGDDKANPAKLDAVGLSHLKPRANFLPASSGPDGKPGVVISWPTDPAGLMGYLPNDQEWTPADADGDRPAGRYWIGFVKGRPPRATELEWPVQVDGQLVKLGDGWSWRMPAAGKLPKNCRRGADGKWGFIVRDQFAQFWEESYRWYIALGEMVLTGNGTYQVDASCCDYLTRALGMNYMLTPEVVSRLELFGTDTILDSLLATVDGQSVRDEEESQKKTDDTQPDT